MEVPKDSYSQRLGGRRHATRAQASPSELDTQPNPPSARANKALLLLALVC